MLWRVSKHSTHASTQAPDTNMHTLAPVPPLRVPRLAQSWSLYMSSRRTRRVSKGILPRRAGSVSMQHTEGGSETSLASCLDKKISSDVLSTSNDLIGYSSNIGVSLLVRWITFFQPITRAPYVWCGVSSRCALIALTHAFVGSRAWALRLWKPTPLETLVQDWQTACPWAGKEQARGFACAGSE